MVYESSWNSTRNIELEREIILPFLKPIAFHYLESQINSLLLILILKILRSLLCACSLYPVHLLKPFDDNINSAFRQALLTYIHFEDPLKLLAFKPILSLRGDCHIFSKIEKVRSWFMNF